VPQLPTQQPGRSLEASDDAEVMREFGYRPALRRRLRPLAMFGISFSFISISTGLYTSFGYGLATLGTASIWVWPVVLAGQMLVALVIAELGSRVPLAGYSYQWGARLIGSGYGWIIAICTLAFFTFAAASAAINLFAPLLGAFFGVTLSADATLAIAVGIVVLGLVLNLVGIVAAAWVNNAGVWIEIVATLALTVALVVAWIHDPGRSVGSLVDTGAVHGISGVLGAIPSAFLLGLFTLTGFELAADLSEDAIGARRSVPRAVLLALTGAGVSGFLLLVGLDLATPNIAKVGASSTPILTIVTYWFGPTVTRIVTAAVIVAVFVGFMVGMAAEARLIFALARDRVIPASGWLSGVGQRTKSPVRAVVVVAALMVAAVVYGHFASNTFILLVDSTAILPFVVYLMIVAAFIVRWRRLAEYDTSFSLGKWRPLVAGIALVWILVALAMLTIPHAYREADITVLVIMALGIVWYVAGLRRRLRNGVAGLGDGKRQREARDVPERLV
jgi:amino acid transporter